jgi:hypothetical protein
MLRGPGALLQGMDLYSHTGPSTDAANARHPGRQVPCFDRLTALSALSLSDNCLEQVPAGLEKLRRLRYLDLSLNAAMQVRHVHAAPFPCS